MEGSSSAPRLEQVKFVLYCHVSWVQSITTSFGFSRIAIGLLLSICSLSLSFLPSPLTDTLDNQPIPILFTNRCTDRLNLRPTPSDQLHPTPLIQNTNMLTPQAGSNDLHMSVEHKMKTNSELERYSVAYSLCPSSDSQIGSCRKPSVYRKFTFGEYGKQGRIYGLPHVRLTERVDVSTESALYNDAWKIRKQLTESDLSHLSRLLLPGGCLKTHVLPQMDEEMLRQVKSKEGMQVVGIDVDTGWKHWFVFRCWGSSGSYVLNGGWTKEFVEKKRLEVGDEIGMVWFMSSRMFYFKVLHRAAA